MKRYYVHGFYWYRHIYSDGSFGYKLFEGFENIVEADNEDSAKNVAIEAFWKTGRKYKDIEYFKPSVEDIDEVNEAVAKPWAKVIPCCCVIEKRFETMEEAQEAVDKASGNFFLVNLNRKENKKYL